MISPSENQYDIIICGGGIAGLCLAQQIRLYLPELRVAVIEQLARPLPEAAFKVGESSIHVGGTYFDKTLQQEEYVTEQHVKKFGVRIFFSKDDNSSFVDRPEFGRAMHDPDIRSYQFDRGKLENHFRSIIDTTENITFYEGYRVANIDVSANGGRESRHTVTVKKTGDHSGDVIRMTGNWLIDASGRRKLIQRALELEKPVEATCSAAWMRVDRAIDVDDFVCKSNHSWHNRIHSSTTDRSRINSTCHLMGDGYWVWLILLPAGMSVGLVADENIVPFESYNTQEKFIDWMRKNEPDLACRLEQADILDFKYMRKYSYLSHRVISENRWACTGEAAFFADPFFSPGFDVIAIINSFIVQAIMLDQKNELSGETIEHINDILLSHGGAILDNIQRMYHVFHDETVTATFGIFWLSWAASYLGNWGLDVIGMEYLEGADLTEDKDGIKQHLALLTSVTKLLHEWAHQRKKQGIETSFNWIDSGGMPAFKDIKKRFFKKDSPWSNRIAALENIVAAIYMYALREVNPDIFQRIPENACINVHALTLDSAKWDEKQVLSSNGEEQGYRHIMQQLTDLYHTE
jgi:2-polyprenyl-6-methoxyphenol hydroxylase-like FAD-dependent oxidoreductase